MRSPGDSANLHSMQVDDSLQRPRYLTCGVCGYGAHVAGDDPRCPMCGSMSWRLDTRRERDAAKVDHE